MRKDLGNKMNFLPLPVLMIGTYGMASNTYRVLGELVGNAFKDGLKLKD